MKAKLQHLIKSEGLTASRFAEMLEIQPAGVSHILAGRNKPSFDLLQKILRRFPKINPDWLLLDSEQMYRDGWENSGDGVGTQSSSGFGGTPQNSGATSGSLFGGASGVGANPSIGGAYYPGGPMSGTVGATGGVANFTNGTNHQRGANGGDFGGVAGGANGARAFGVGNLPFGESHISGGAGIPTHLSNSRAGQPIQKIVIFYADGTFEAYF